MRQPTSDECYEHSEVEDGPHQYAFAAWHPQWGGYASHCVVSFSRVPGADDEPGCFDVANFHDGEFPGDVAKVLHYCSALQVVNFGLTILEQQLQHQKREDGAPLATPVKALEVLRERINTMLNREKTT